MDQFTVLDLLDLDARQNNYLSLECIAGRSGLINIIKSPKVNRPGLALSGFFQDFSSEAIQLFGHGEESYINQLEGNNKTETIYKIFSYSIPCIILSESYSPSPLLITLAEKEKIPLLVTKLDSTIFTRRLYSLFDEIFAKTETVHAVFVEVFGLGVLIQGDSGIGKSETALELIERGHRLISDDVVRLKAISDTHLIGSGENPLFSHRMEIRGIGILNISNLFGIGAIREKKQVQLVVKLKYWDEKENYDRLSSEQKATFLGIEVPSVTIPILPGKNIPILIETAARNERLKKLGYYASKEFEKDFSHFIETRDLKGKNNGKKGS